MEPLAELAAQTARETIASIAEEKASVAHDFVETAHPRGPGGKWTAKFGGPIHGMDIPDVSVTGREPADLAEQIHRHIHQVTGKRNHSVDVNLHVRHGIYADATGEVGTRKAFRDWKTTPIKLRHTGTANDHITPYRDTYEDRP